MKKTENKNVEVVRTGEVGRPKGLKIAWPTGAIQMNMFRFNKDKAIADKMNTSVPNVFVRRRSLNKKAKLNGGTGTEFLFVKPEDRKTGKKEKVETTEIVAEPVAEVATEIKA